MIDLDPSAIPLAAGLTLDAPNCLQAHYTSRDISVPRPRPLPRRSPSPPLPTPPSVPNVMADYSMYHALGQGEQLDPNDPNRTTQPAPPQFVPPVAQQQQPPQQQYYGGVPSPASPPQGYGAPPPQQQQFGGPTDLASQMAGLGIADNAQHTARRKKKDRHAFHNVEAPTGSSQAFNGIPPTGTSQTAFLNADPSVQAGGQFIGQPLTPNQFANQFPVPVNSTFSPTVASPAEFAARNGTPADLGPQSAFVPASGGAQVSPDDIPSVPVSRDVPQQHYLNNVYPTFERHVPPPASISYVAYDQGNSAPKFTRLTMNNIPANAEGLKSTGLPLGLIVQPLAKLQPGELEIPVLDFGDQGPPRCRRCRSYINPFMMFRSGGSKFVCNLCTYPNDTPSEYFCATNPQGVRVDRDQRPELSRGTVEFVVPKEYWTKEPVGLNWLFVIDVTQEAFNKGFLEAFCEGILAALYAPEGGEDERDENGEPKRRLPPGAKVGFVSYDKDIHFYSCHVRTCSLLSDTTGYTDCLAAIARATSDVGHAGYRGSVCPPEHGSLRRPRRVESRHHLTFDQTPDPLLQREEPRACSAAYPQLSNRGSGKDRRQDSVFAVGTAHLGAWPPLYEGRWKASGR